MKLLCILELPLVSALTNEESNTICGVYNARVTNIVNGDYGDEYTCECMPDLIMSKMLPQSTL